MNAGLMADLPSLTDRAPKGWGCSAPNLQFLTRTAACRAGAIWRRFTRMCWTAPMAKPVMFRTLDIGSDKVLPHEAAGRAELRNGLARDPRRAGQARVLRMQLQALIRAAVGRPALRHVPLCHRWTNSRMPTGC